MKTYAFPQVMKVSKASLLLVTLILTTIVSGAAQGQKSKPHVEKAVSALKKTKNPSARRGHESGMRPGNAQFFDYDDNQWEHTENITYEYYPNGLLKEQIITEAGTNTNSERWTYAYNAEGEEIESARYMWQNGAWAQNIGEKTLETYENGKLVEEVEQTWRTSGEGSGQWENTARSTYSFDAEGRPTGETAYGWDGESWVAERKFVYEYTTGNAPSTILMQRQEDNNWVSFARLVELGWHEDAEQDGLADYTMQALQDGNWVNMERQETRFTGNGGYVETTQTFEENNWVNDFRITVQYDAHHNKTLDQYEEWVDQNGDGMPQDDEWLIEDALKYVNTYDSNDNLTEIISQSWELNGGPGAFQNRERWVFSNFQNVLSAKEEQQLALHVYPNPAVGQLSVKMEKGAGASVRLVSLTGQTMLNTSLASAEAQELDLSAVPAGTYILQIQSKAGLRTQKIVKL